MKELLLMFLLLVAVPLSFADSGVSIIRPSYDASPLQWSSTNYYHYQAVNEGVPDEDRTGISESVLNDQDTFGYPNDPNNWESPPLNNYVRINYIELWEMARKTTLVNTPSMSMGVNFPTGMAQLLIYPPYAYTNFYYTYYSVDNEEILESRPLTVVDLNNLETSYKIRSSLKGTIRVTQTFVKIFWEYIVGCNGIEDCVINCSLNPVVDGGQAIKYVNVGGFNITFTGNGTVLFDPDTSIINFDTLIITDGCTFVMSGNNSLG